jgi:hypothetical protein
MKVLLLTLSIFLSLNCFAQIEPVDVADLTIKIGAVSGEDLYYGFAEGDEIIFSFEELKGKALKEIEITELPTNSKFMDFKSTWIADKRIKVNKTAVYKFSFWNSSLAGRVCHINIQRIPKSNELKNFNTNWEWKKLYDTSYVAYTEDSIVGYDTTYIPYTQKDLVKVDTTCIDKTKNERVHTNMNVDGDVSVVTFYLPQNIRTSYKTQEVISWAYWFGTAGAPKVSAHLATASKLVSSFSLVGGLALGVLSLTSSTAGNNINYCVLDNATSKQLFLSESGGWRYYDKGDGNSASNRVQSRLQQTVYIGFDNDHTYPVDVNVRVSAVVVTKIYEDKQYEKEKITARKVTLDKKRMVVKESKVRVNTN